MGLETVPFIDEEEDGDRRNSEDNHDEQVADFGHSFPPQPLGARGERFLAAAGGAATDSFAKTRTHFLDLRVIIGLEYVFKCALLTNKLPIAKLSL